ncbi:MAG TPA: polysaccharide biosynthesis tyrosine autokinase [Chitinophagaceae bacterium]|nr:polysaccharide biosynthesis tyrosine autokinase [Chitinophagaceae bacterium]
MEELLNSNRSELGNLSLRDLFFKYIRFLPIFVLSVALMLFGAYIYLRYATSIYNANGTLLIKSEQQKGSNGDKFEDLFMNNRAVNIQSEIEILKSKQLMERVVNKLNLQISYYGVGKIKKGVNIYKQGPFTLEIFELSDSFSTFSFNLKFVNDSLFYINNENQTYTFGQLFRNSNGVFRFTRNPLYPVSKEYNVTWQPASTVASGLIGSLQVVPKTVGTGILSITMQGTNAKMCSDVINQLMQEYDTLSIEDKNIASEQTLRFINDRLDSLGRDLDSIQKVLVDFELKNNVIDLEKQSALYFDNSKETDKAISEQQFQLDVVGFVNNYLTDKKNEFTKVVVPSALGLPDPVLNGYIEAYNKAQLERQDLIVSGIPAGNPAVKEKNSLIEKLRQSIEENLKNIKSSIDSSVDDLKKKSGLTQSQINALPNLTKEFLEIKSEVERKQNLFRILQEKREETAISRAATNSNSKVVDFATPNYSPIKPNRRAVQLVAILMGLALPAIFIFIGEILNDKITTRFDIEKITAVPILGEIGHSFSDTALVVNKNTRSMVAEQFRIIRSNLQYVLSNSEKSVILITSSFSGEGKSFVCTNLGAVMALTGKKTIILEFDIRKPKILSGLNLRKSPGISNFIVGKTELAELILPVPESENLYVLACGPVPPNPAELLLEQKVTELFEYLKQNFDIIIVDTAPVGMVSDAMTLSKFADCTLYLVRQGHTFKKQITLIDDFYKQNKLPKVSIVINDVKLKAGYGYYGYGRYGYGYGYNYGSYYEEETPTTLFGRMFHRFNGKRKKKSPKNNSKNY